MYGLVQSEARYKKYVYHNRSFLNPAIHSPSRLGLRILYKMFADNMSPHDWKIFGLEHKCTI